MSPAPNPGYRPCDKLRGRRTRKLSRDPWLRLSRAARILGVSKRTLWRTRQRGLLKTRIVWNREWGTVLVRWSDLQRAPLLTLGKAAQLCGLRYTTLRRWAKRGRLRCWRFRGPITGELAKAFRAEGREPPFKRVGYRRTSLQAVLRAIGYRHRRQCWARLRQRWSRP